MPHTENTPTETPASRRELWLRIALAVAEHGLPEPDIRLGDGKTYAYLRFNRHSHAATWGLWLDVPGRHYDRPDLGTRYLDYNAVKWGWRLDVSGCEPLPAADDGELAAKVVSAILAPDAEVPA